MDYADNHGSYLAGTYRYHSSSPSQGWANIDQGLAGSWSRLICWPQTVARFALYKLRPLRFDSFGDSFARRLCEASGDAWRRLRHFSNTAETR